MSEKVYTFSFSPNWMQFSKELSQIDRFDASWTAIEKREGKTLKQLKSIATVRSVGASTRIEGSKMTDEEVEVLIRNLSIAKLEERDQQEVAGYFEVLEMIAESYREIEITENNLKSLHNTLVKYSEKDAWHKGDYKQQSNMVEATNPDGSKYIIFRTTEPGFATQDAMRNLVEWYHNDNDTLPLIKVAAFVYDFLSIHPFQDGNGRLSRLLGTLLLLKLGYSWIQYVSLEHEIESRKGEYYKVLMQCQRERPGEEINSWVMFFWDCLKNIQHHLMEKLEVQARTNGMSGKQKVIYSFIENHAGSSSSEIAEKLNIALPTVKKILSGMQKNKMITMTGAGKSTTYYIEANAAVKKDLAMRFTSKERKKEFTLANQGAYIEIKKIILTPLFKWTHPDEWATRLLTDHLALQVTCSTNDQLTVGSLFTIASYNTGYDFQPVFMLKTPINIPGSLWKKVPYQKDFPMRVTIELEGSSDEFGFEVMAVYDEA